IVMARPAEATLVLPAMSACLAVSVWLPAASVELVIDQLPEASARPVPSTVVPLVSNSVTVAPASAPPPVNTGVVLLVMLSVCEVPVSVAAVMSGADGAAAAVSIVMARPAEATLVLPAMSVCLAVSVWLPADSVELVIDQLPEASASPVPSTVVPLVSNSVTVAPASAPPPANTGVVLLVMLSVCEVPVSVAAVMSGADGAAAAVSIVMARPAEATLVLPAMSVCLAVTVWLPAASVELVIDQLPEASASPVPSTVVPLVSNSVTVAPASAPPPANTGVVLLVMLSVCEVPVSVAA